MEFLRYEVVPADISKELLEKMKWNFSLVF
jgi:hypothetical protein